MMKRAVMQVAILLVVAGAISLAQTKPNFSGTWAYDKDKSDPPPMGRMGGGGGPGGGGGGPMGDIMLVVTQTPTELTIETKTGDRSEKAVYKLDGSESTNPGGRGGQVKSKTRWDGDKLVTEGSQAMSGPMGDMTINFKEVRTLGADGTVLTVERTTQTPRGENTRKTVFTKKTT